MITKQKNSRRWEANGFCKYTAILMSSCLLLSMIIFAFSDLVSIRKLKQVLKDDISWSPCPDDPKFMHDMEPLIASYDESVGIENLEFMSHSSKYLLIAAAYNLKPKDLQLFLESIRKNVPQCDILLLTDDHVDSERITLFKRLRIMFYKEKMNPRQHAQQFRYIGYRAVLQTLKNMEHQKKYDLIGFSDSKDVVFQGSPFDVLRRDYPSFIKKGGVFFSIEGTPDNPIQLKDTPVNAAWVANDCFPYNPAFAGKQKNNESEIYSQIKDYPVSNSGVTFGTPSALLEYTKVMVTTLYTSPDFCFKIKGADQGVHMAVLYFLGYIKKSLTFNIYPMWNGRLVFTLRAQNPVYSITEDGMVSMKYQNKTFFPPAVHQYNDYDDLDSMYKEKFKASWQ